MWNECNDGRWEERRGVRESEKEGKKRKRRRRVQS